MQFSIWSLICIHNDREVYGDKCWIQSAGPSSKSKWIPRRRCQFWDWLLPVSRKYKPSNHFSYLSSFPPIEYLLSNLLMGRFDNILMCIIMVWLNSSFIMVLTLKSSQKQEVPYRSSSTQSNFFSLLLFHHSGVACFNFLWLHSVLCCIKLALPVFSSWLVLDR